MGGGEIRKCSICSYVDSAIPNSIPITPPETLPGFPGVLGIQGEKVVKWVIFVGALKIAFLMTLLLISLL